MANWPISCGSRKSRFSKPTYSTTYQSDSTSQTSDMSSPMNPKVMTASLR